MTEGNTLPRDQVKQAVIDFLTGFSIECTPHDRKKFDEFVAELPADTRVYVAHPPGMPIDEVVSLSVDLKKAGMNPVPHIIARKLSSREQLAGALASLQQAGVDEALCIAGDIAVDDNAYDSSLEVLETGLFGEYGFKEVGVAGHPEGSKAIGDRVGPALAAKVEFARSAPFNVRIVTQFGFDADAFIDWERETTATGVNLPVHVGVAGPASLRQLAKFAVMCGVGASARMIVSRTSDMANLLKTQAPDDLLVQFGTHKALNPESRLTTAHFFAFGGVAKSARWAKAVLNGDFELNKNGTGFEVS